MVNLNSCQCLNKPCYISYLKELEEHGILKQIHRFAGASAGAIGAALYAVGFNSYDVEQIMKVDLEPIICGKRNTMIMYFILYTLKNILKQKTLENVVT